jgi:hypothetical protein
MERLKYVTVLNGLAAVFLFAAKPEWFGDGIRLAASVLVTAIFVALLISWGVLSHMRHPTKGCLVMDDQGVQRFITWRGRTDVHLVEREEPPRQLLAFFKPLCDSIREQTSMEPAFNVAESIKGDIVYELSRDGKAKWRLLGGMNGAPADQVLVVNPKKR